MIRRVASRSLVWFTLAFYALVSVYPFLWLLSGAVKTPGEAVSSPSLIPSAFTLEGFVDAWTKLDFQQYFLNSISVTGMSILVAFVLYAPAGYAFSVAVFRGKNVIYGAFLALLFVPGIVTLLPIILLQTQLGLLGTHFGLALVFGTGSGPLAVMLFRTVFDSVPAELREAAKIDGASEFWIFARVYLPLGKAAFATVGILTFVAVWNEYVVSGISLSDPTRFTLPIGLQRIASANVVHWNEVMAGSVILVIPVIIGYVLTRRLFESGLTGAVKG